MKADNIPNMVAEKRRPGRPTKIRQGKQCHVVLPADVRKGVETFAEKNDLEFSDGLRRLLRKVCVSEGLVDPRQ